MFNEPELQHKQEEVLETGVEVCLFFHQQHLMEVMVVDVCIHSKQPSQNCFDDRHEVARKEDPNPGGEECFIVQMVPGPLNKAVNVLRGRASDGPLERAAISPAILVLGTSRHHRTATLGAEFCNSAVDHADLVEEVHCVDSYPLVEVYTFR